MLVDRTAVAQHETHGAGHAVLVDVSLQDGVDARQTIGGEARVFCNGLGSRGWRGASLLCGGNNGEDDEKERSGSRGFAHARILSP